MCVLLCEVRGGGRKCGRSWSTAHPPELSLTAVATGGRMWPPGMTCRALHLRGLMWPELQPEEQGALREGRDAEMQGVPLRDRVLSHTELSLLEPHG